MADPITLATISLIATGAGAGMSAYGSYQGGQASKAMYNYQSRVAQINAGIAQEQARAETVAGGIRAQRSGLETGYKTGLTRAGMAAGGLDLSSGSAKNVLGSETEIGQFEQRTIRSDAARRAYGYEVGAFGDVAQAGVYGAAGQQAAVAGDIGVGTSLLGGATQVSDKWVKFNETGAFGPTPPPPTVMG